MDPPRGEGATPPPQDEAARQGNQENDKSAHQSEDDEDLDQQQVRQNNKHPKVSSATCKPVASERPRVELPGHKINAQIQFMRDHALIGKFIGLWSTEKALRTWIAAKWNPKGHITLQLGPKGFFIAIFNCLEDRNRVLDGGPYFFNVVGLYLRGWVERFNPGKEDLS